MNHNDLLLNPAAHVDSVDGVFAADHPAHNRLDSPDNRRFHSIHKRRRRNSLRGSVYGHVTRHVDRNRLDQEENAHV